MRTTSTSVAALLLLASSSVPLAQTFPSKPLHLIVPSVAGSSPDVRARQIAAKLAESLGQPVIVDNRPGGNGLIGAQAAAKSAPDGYTMFLALINNAIADAANPNPCCRLNLELVPVSRFTMTPLVAVAHPSLPAKTLAEFIALAKAKPDALTYASGGPGSITQLLGEWIKSESGIRVLEVPYKSVGAEMPDLLSGQVTAGFLVPNTVGGPIKSGKLRALAVAGPQRLAVLPEVPTTAEAGLPGVEAIAWNGVFVPAGTPRPVIAVLHRELVRAFNASDVREQVANTGSYIAGDSPEEFAAFVRAEVAKWGRVIRNAGIKVQ
jgi:tripartite-type tricarboxylate transporter receptor subunit TctC